MLSGENDVNITGNNYSNLVVGNAGNNFFTGFMADDFFDGKEGNDRAVFSGNYSDYAVLYEDDWNDGVMSVVDLVPNRDGIDTLVRVEEMDFDGIIYTIGEELNIAINDFIPDEFKLSLIHI